MFDTYAFIAAIIVMSTNKLRGTNQTNTPKSLMKNSTQQTIPMYRNF